MSEHNPDGLHWPGCEYEGQVFAEVSYEKPECICKPAEEEKFYVECYTRSMESVDFLRAYGGHRPLTDDEQMWCKAGVVAAITVVLPMAYKVFMEEFAKEDDE